MTTYSVHTETDDNGDHLVHTADCESMPDAAHRTELGDFDGCEPALAAARGIYRRCTGCPRCCDPFDTS